MLEAVVTILVLLFMCLSAFKAGETYNYSKMNKLFEKALIKSDTVEVTSQQIGWIDCLLYLMSKEGEK